MQVILVEVRRPPVAGPEVPSSFGVPGERGLVAVDSAEIVSIAAIEAVGG